MKEAARPALRGPPAPDAHRWAARRAAAAAAALDPYLDGLAAAVNPDSI